MIVFPLTEGPYLDPLKFENGEEKFARISWSQVVSIWKKAVPGTDEDKNDALQQLAKVWCKRTGILWFYHKNTIEIGAEPKDEDAMRMNAWLTIAREAIIEQLTNKCGLQLKLSANSSQIFCRIRAPIKLLESQADKNDYPLQFRGEIDPGSEDFWNVEVNNIAVEIEEEKKIYSLDEAKLILEKLYRAGKISPNELLINPDQENQASYSRRIHALERIADKVPVTNKFIPYAPFLTNKPHLRYLYQTYPSVRGSTLFRSKDRLLLTKSIIDKIFDIDVLATYGVADSIMALHDANRGEKLTIEVLSKRWVSFWSTSAKEIGCPYVTHPAYDENVELSWYLRPLSQPLSDIREYFGEKVAIYFTWFGFFTYYLLYPALMGLVMEMVFLIRGYPDTLDSLDWSAYVFAFLMITWSAIYEQCWLRECKAVALKWVTLITTFYYLLLLSFVDSNNINIMIYYHSFSIIKLVLIMIIIIIIITIIMIMGHLGYKWFRI